MSASGTERLWRGRVLALVGIVLFAFSLRTGVASFSPLVPLIDAEFDLPAVVVGLVGTVPPVCYAIFGILTPQLEKRIGLERSAIAAMALTAVGLLSRGLSFDVTSLVVSTVLVFAGLGVANILLPPLAKKYFPDRLGLVMTIYTTTIGVSTFIPPLVVVPLADAASWHLSLGLWAVFAAIAMVPWIALILRRRSVENDEPVEAVNPLLLSMLWRSKIAWALTAGFVVSGVIAYFGFTWLPQLLIEVTGASLAAAGALLSLFAMVSLPVSLIVPVLVVRFNAARVLYLFAAFTGSAAAIGFVVAPGAPSWIWVLMFGASGLLFPVTFVLLAVRTRSHEWAVSLSAFVQAIGYAVAAIFPLGFGVLHDLTDGWTVPLIVLTAVTVCAVPAGIIASRPGTVEEEWERRVAAADASV